MGLSPGDGSSDYWIDLKAIKKVLERKTFLGRETSLKSRVLG